MTFRHPSAAAEMNAASLKYLTQHLTDKAAGIAAFESLLAELGNTVESYPSWHPILTTPPNPSSVSTLSSLYAGLDHTVNFVRGFITCPYSEDGADKLVTFANSLPNIRAYRLDSSLYSDTACPVVVEALLVELEGDGTIRSRDALALYIQDLVKHVHHAEVGDTWWNLKHSILGAPSGSRSSLFVNQYTGGHMRKILDALNNSGMFGEIMEWSLDMLPKKKREVIGETLIRAAIVGFNSKGTGEFEFELNGETCTAKIRDTWEDGTELSINVRIGELNDTGLLVTGFYYPKTDVIEATEPKGKRAIAEKFTC